MIEWHSEDGKCSPMITFNWDTIQTGIQTLAYMLAPKKPKLIVGISRGGLIPATMLSHMLNNIPVATISASAYEGTRRTLQKPIVIEGWKDLYNSPTTVVIDDILDSGDTLDALLYGDGRTSVNFYPTYACLVNKQCERFPNTKTFFAQVPKGTWVKFPWE